MEQTNWINIIMQLFFLVDFVAKIGLISKVRQCSDGTPFENPQRWMGQNTFPIWLLNDDNMIGEH